MRVIITLAIIAAFIWGGWRTLKLVDKWKNGTPSEQLAEEMRDDSPIVPAAPAPAPAAAPAAAPVADSATVERLREDSERKLLDLQEKLDRAERLRLQEVEDERQANARREAQRIESEKGFVFHRFLNREVPKREAIAELFEGKLTIDERSNLAVVRTETLTEAVKASEVLKALDERSNLASYQVEAVVVQAQLSRAEEFSIDWLAKFDFPAPKKLFGRGSFAPGALEVDSDWFSLAIERAKDSGSLSILAKPHLVLSQGERATISSGREVPLQTVSVSDGNSQSGIEYRKAALSLEVGLVEVGEGRIAIEIKQINSQVSGSVRIGETDVPEFTSQEWGTRLEAEFGRWYALGGVASVQDSKAATKGWVFKSKERSSSDRRELGLFVRVVPVESAQPPAFPSSPTLRAVPVE